MNEGSAVVLLSLSLTVKRFQYNVDVLHIAYVSKQSEPCDEKAKRFSQHIGKIFGKSSHRSSLLSTIACLQVQHNSFSGNFQNSCLQFRKLSKDIKKLEHLFFRVD